MKKKFWKTFWPETLIALAGLVGGCSFLLTAVVRGERKLDPITLATAFVGIAMGIVVWRIFREAGGLELDDREESETHDE